MSNKENRRKIIQFLAGGYLTYLAFQLYSDVFHEIQDSTFRVIFFLFATLFFVVGLLLMFFVLRSEFKRSYATVACNLVHFLSGLVHCCF